jgi:hypothetical protein
MIYLMGGNAMQLVRILKRKDAASVSVAVVLAIFVSTAVSVWASAPAAWLSGTSNNSATTGGFRYDFWQPLLLLVIEVLFFELLVRVYLAASAYSKKK